MTIFDFLTATGNLLNQFIPVLIGIAFLFFIWNAFRYFILGGANPDEQEKARSLAVWGIAAFVVIISLWGMVNIVAGMLDVGNNNPVVPDYILRRSQT